MPHDDERHPGSGDPDGLPAGAVPTGDAGAADPAVTASSDAAVTAAEPATPPPAAELPSWEPAPLLPVRPARRPVPLPVALMGGLVLGVVATLAILSATGRLGTGPIRLEPGSAAFTSADRSAGSPDAPITIEIWADYQCPYCGLFTHGIEPSLIRTFAATGQALIRFRDFAFLGQESVDAAVAARCAERQDAFWQYHDLLYASQSGENQGAFATGNLVKLAEYAGLDSSAFGSCLADRTVAAEVTDETAAGRTLGIESTPSIRIVGAAGTTTYKGLVPFETIARGVAEVAAGRPSDTSGDAASPGPSVTAAP